MNNKIFPLILVLFIPTIAWCRDYTSDKGCVFAYLFNEGAGTTVNDSSGNGFTGTFSSSGHPGWTATVPTLLKYGTLKNSVVSDATSYITVGTPNIMTTAGPSTFVTWFFATSAPAANPHYLDMGGNFRLGQDINSNALTDLYLETNGTTTLIRDSATGQFALNTWTFVVWTWDGSITASNVHIYVATAASPTVTEVSSYATTTNGVGLINYSGTTLYLLNRSDSARPFLGDVAQSAGFNRILTLAEMQDIANNGLTGNGSFFMSQEYKRWKKFYHNEGFI